MKINFLMIKNTWDYLLLLSSSFNFGQKRNKGAALIMLLLLLTTTKGYSQCTFPTTTATKVGSDNTFCIDNINTITTASVNAGQFVVVNVVKGFNYTFSVGDAFTATGEANRENLTIFNDINNSNFGLTGYSVGQEGTSITWTSTISGKVKVLFSKNCGTDTSGTNLKLTLNAVGNTQDSQDDFGNNTWVAHVYNLSTSQIPPGGTSPATPTAAYPFLTANYVGNYNIASDKIDQDFGGYTACLPVTSAATNIYTETFAVRYRMQSTKTGYYFLDVTGDDGVRVYVDDVLVFNEWKQQGPTNYCNILVYLTGTSKIVVDYYDSASQNIVKFNLTPFNASSNVIAGSNPINVCSGSSPGTLVAPAYESCSPQTISNVIYQWQVSSDNNTWANVASAGNAKDYVVPAITTSANNIRYFRRNLKQTAGTSTQPLSSSNVIRVNTSAANILETTGAITGTASQCAAATGLVYSVDAVTNALNYAWTVPSGWNITAGQGTTSITVTTGAAGQNGNIAVTASNGCTANAVKTLAVTVSAIPTAVTAVASAITICEGGSINLSATATANSNVTLIDENFNVGNSLWTKTNTSTGGTTTNAAWTLRANNYNYSNTIFTSNDSSQFYLTNSYSQGTGGTTATTLRSPSFSTVGLSSASLSFYHYYRDYNGTDAAKVEISTDNGTNWTTLQTYTTTQGTNNAFVKVTIDLSSSSYLGKANVSVRFKYNAVYSYYWAIDNVSVTGVSNTNSATYAWTSTPAGFTSSLQNPTGVKPTENTTYTVKVTNGSGCSATATTEMVVINPNLPANVSIAANTGITICAGTSVTFTATPTNGGTSPTYQWKVNGSSITGAISSTYTTAALANNNTVSVVMTSNASPCSTGSAASNALTMTVGSGIPTTYLGGTSWSNGTPNISKKAIFPQNYSTSIGQDFIACSCQVDNGATLIVGEKSSITIQNDIVNNGKIIIESDANLIQVSNAGTYTGPGTNFTVKRDIKMKKMDYTYWSSPVDNQILKNISNVNLDTSVGGFSPGTPNNRTYRYDEPTDYFRETDDANFVPGKGYAIRGKSKYGTTRTPDTFTFMGKPNTGIITTAVQRSANTTSGTVTYEHGYNMIGNPYPSGLDFVKFHAANSTIIDGKAWFWSTAQATGTMTGSVNYTPNNYAAITLAGGAPPTFEVPAQGAGNFTPTKNIKVAQGFIVQVSQVRQPINVQFTNEMRTADAGIFYNNFAKGVNSAVNRYWLRLISPDQIINTLLLAHISEASQGMDSNYDAELFTVGDDSFYSVLEDRKMQIQAREDFSPEAKIKLGTQHFKKGNYTISLENPEGIFGDGQPIFLKDNLLNTYTNLQTQDYVYAEEAGLTEGRFEIVYKPSGVLAAGIIAKDSFLVYRNGNNFTIENSKNIKTVEVYDGIGRLVDLIKKSSKKIDLAADLWLPGIYLLKVTYEDGTAQTKKVLK